MRIEIAGREVGAPLSASLSASLASWPFVFRAVYPRDALVGGGIRINDEARVWGDDGRLAFFGYLDAFEDSLSPEDADAALMFRSAAADFLESAVWPVRGFPGFSLARIFDVLWTNWGGDGSPTFPVAGAEEAARQSLEGENQAKYGESNGRYLARMAAKVGVDIVDSASGVPRIWRSGPARAAAAVSPIISIRRRVNFAGRFRHYIAGAQSDTDRAIPAGQDPAARSRRVTLFPVSGEPNGVALVNAAVTRVRREAAEGEKVVAVVSAHSEQPGDLREVNGEVMVAAGVRWKMERDDLRAEVEFNRPEFWRGETRVNWRDAPKLSAAPPAFQIQPGQFPEDPPGAGAARYEVVGEESFRGRARAAEEKKNAAID